MPVPHYAWCTEPQAAHAIDDARVLGHIKHAWLASGCVYGYRKVFDDMRESGERCGPHRVARAPNRVWVTDITTSVPTRAGCI